MKSIYAAVIIVVGIFFQSCSQQENKQEGNNKNASGKYEEGKDYVLLKRFREIDNSGFNQPVEAFSLMLPSQWQVKSSVNWNGASKCMPEILQATITANSPDGNYELMMLPVTQFDWSDDPLTLDAMQRGGFVYSCRLQKPQDAAGYIQNELAPQIKATVNAVQNPPQLQEAMQQGAMQMKQAAAQAGNNAYDYAPSAAEAKLNFADGKEGLALVTLMQTIVTTPGAFTHEIKTFQCYVSMRLIIKFQKGSEAEARKILGVAISSTRANPLWAQAVQKTFQAIQKGAQNTLGQIIEITTNAQNEISKNITRSWENAGADDNNTKAWSEYIRGVDNWADGEGNKVELTSGYSNAWSKGDGTYLLTNDVSFDPNVAFSESWSALKK